MRALLGVCAMVNLAGAVVFAPPVTSFRALLELPPTHSFYLWLISAWTVAFGTAFAHQAWTGRIQSQLLIVAVWAKLVFALALLNLVLTGGASPLGYLSAAVDAGLALLLAQALWQRRTHA